MPIFRGTYYQLVIQRRNKSDGLPIDMTGWTFSASIKDENGTEILAATSAGEQFVLEDAENGEVRFQLLAAETTAMTTDRIKYDALRTDASPGPIWLFRFEADVRNLGS